MKEYPIDQFYPIVHKPKIKSDQFKSKFADGSFAELYDSYLKYRVLFEFGKVVISETQIDQIIANLLDKLIELTGAERCMIILFDSKGKMVYQTGRKLEKKDVTRPEFDLSWTIINKVRESKQTVFLENAVETPEFKSSNSVSRLKILSVMCLPLLHLQQFFGVLYADNRTAEGIFRKQTLDIMKQFIEMVSGPLYSTFKNKELKNNIEKLEKQTHIRKKYPSIIGHSPKIQKVLEFIDQVAKTDATVLIEGASGTGKELVAREMHENSKRKLKPFIPLNCGAMPETLLESELFGYVKGAFTGAVSDKKGWFEISSGGTIFFDEISEMSPALQIKLLRVLQTGEMSAVGSTDIKTSQVRVIAATNEDLEKCIKEGRFRKDLYYRLHILNIKVPPLSERRGDILLLAAHFLREYEKQFNRKELVLTPETKNILLAYNYPGNVRELENAMQRAVILARQKQILPEHLPESFLSQTTVAGAQGKTARFNDAKQSVIEQFESEYIKGMLLDHSGVVTRAARAAGMDPKNFYQKMNKYGINPHKYKM